VDDEVKKEIEDHIHKEVAAAFLSVDEILEGVSEVFFEDPDEYTEEIANETKMIARKAVDQLMKSQQSWPTPTDNDLLEQAFEDLEKQGIVARENWTCCQTCGHAEIGEEMEEAQEDDEDRPVIGYTFYHQQDTDSAVEGAGVMLAYGSVSEENTLDVPKKIVETLSRHGLKVKWDGTLKERILIEQFEWRRRWTGESS
jgi:hypothetical protein